MKKLIETIGSHQLLAALIFASLLSVLNKYGAVLIGAGVLGLFLKAYKENFILYFSIITFVVVSENIDPGLRLAVQLINILMLSGIFIYKFGFQFTRYPKFPSEAGIFLLSLLIVMSISAWHSNYFAIGVSQILRTVIFFMIIYLYYGILDSTEKVKAVIISLIIAACIFSVILFYQLYNAGFNLIEFNEQLLTDLGGTYIHKNAMGGFYIIILPIILSRLLFFHVNKSERSILIVLFIVLIVGLIVTNSRAALAALAVSILFLLFFKNKRLFYISLITAVAAAFLLMVVPLSHEMEAYFRLERVSTGRDLILESIEKVIARNLLLGAGPGGTKYELYKEMPFLLGSFQELFIRRIYNMIEFGHAHNFYLFFMSDLGIPGLLLSVFCPILFFKLFFEVLKEVSTIYRYLILGIAASGAGLFVRAFFEWSSIISYGTIKLDLPFWLMFIILIFFHSKKYYIKNSGDGRINGGINFNQQTFRH